MNRPRKGTELYHEYKKNLKAETAILKEKLKGKVIHLSSMLMPDRKMGVVTWRKVQVQGTYVKDKT